MIDRMLDVAPLLRGYGTHLGGLPAVLARRYGDRPALEGHTATGNPLELTFAQVEEETSRLAGRHRASGVDDGDVVLTLLENRVALVLHLFALARLGAVAVPVNARLAAPEVAAVAAAADATRVLADPEPARRLAGGAVADRPLVLTAPDDDVDAGDLPSLAGADPVESVDRDPDDVVLLLATSGTTGTPKAASLTSHGLLSALGRLAVAPVGGRWGPRAGRDLVLAALPLTHVMGLSVVLGALCAGVPLLHLSRFDPEDVLDLLERRRPNVFVGVPTMYADLEEHGAADRDLASVQIWISGADVMPPARARRFQQYGAAGVIAGQRVGTSAFADVYGLVELSGPAAIRVFPPSLFRPLPIPPVIVTLPGVQVRAVDDHGDHVAWGRVGELQFRGPNVLRDYAGHADEGPSDEGWFATGDLGRVWPGNVFTFAGRTRDRLKVGGFSVFPAEVETELRRHPEVRDVALVGRPDEREGERPVALVVPASDAFDREAFLEWAAHEVAGYRRPREVYVTDRLPRGAHDKVDRAEATRMVEELAGERVERA